MAESNKDIPLISKIIATGFFSGYIPSASGTFGTCVGVLIYLFPGFEQPFWSSVWIVLGFFAGVITSAQVARIAGNTLSPSAQRTKEIFQPGSHASADPSIVVIDEIVGVWIALFLLPKSVVAIIIAFLAFRVFDIIKPFPAKQFERLPNGWGIMLDDVAAGVYANIVARIILYMLGMFSMSGI